jgi:hypothetical protein
MRKSRPAKNAAAEEKRERDAIDEACYRLARVAVDTVSWVDEDMRTYDPAKERRHAIAMVKCVAEELGKGLYAEQPQTKVQKQEDLPAVGFCATVLRAAIPALERTLPANNLGRSADLWRERNEAIAETRKLICDKRGKYGFTQERGNWIIKQALEELQDLFGWFEKFGFEKPRIALSESRIREICRVWGSRSPD